MNRCSRVALFVSLVFLGAAVSRAESVYQLTDLGTAVSWDGPLEFLPNGTIGGLADKQIGYPDIIGSGPDVNGQSVITGALSPLAWEDLPHGVTTPAVIQTLQGTAPSTFAVLHDWQNYYSNGVGEFLSGPNSGDALLLLNGQYLDLNNLVDPSGAGWRLEQADSFVYANGLASEIIGLGRAPDGTLHGFELTFGVHPGGAGSAGSSNVPESPSVALLLLGTATLGLWRWRSMRSH